MESQTNNDEQTKETLPNYYGWYSQKMKNIQNDNIDFKSTLNNNKYIYYKDYNNNIIEITFVTKKKEHNLKWDDIVFIGELKEFYKVTQEPIKYMTG